MSFPAPCFVSGVLRLTSVLPRALAATVADVVYGMRVTSMDAEYVRTVEAAIRAALDSRAPGSYWVEYFPFLKHLPGWMPGGRATRFVERTRPILTRARNYGFDYVKASEVSVSVRCVGMLMRRAPCSRPGRASRWRSLRLWRMRRMGRRRGGRRLRGTRRVSHTSVNALPKS